VFWYRKAADQGYVSAQYSLAFCLDNGDGVDQDSEESTSWFRKAAEQGHVGAQNWLGFCFRSATGSIKIM
jgi:uncharacterized protein